MHASTSNEYFYCSYAILTTVFFLFGSVLMCTVISCSWCVFYCYRVNVIINLCKGLHTLAHIKLDTQFFFSFWTSFLLCSISALYRFRIWIKNSLEKLFHPVLVVNKMTDSAHSAPWPLRSPLIQTPSVSLFSCTFFCGFLHFVVQIAFPISICDFSLTRLFSHDPA